MREAIVPVVATGVLAFVVHRWAADELERGRRLSPGAAAAAVGLVLLHAMLVCIAALGGVLPFDAPAGVAVPLGLALGAAGVLVALRAIRTLGTRERVLGMRTDRLVAHGPYRYARHPVYLGWTVALLGIALAGRSLLALALVLLLALALARIARGEERLLSEELGGAYDEYRGLAPAVVGRGLSQPARSESLCRPR